MPACTAASALQVFFGLVHTSINTQTPADLRSHDLLRSENTYDFIVVGGGSAGCVVASRLSEIKDWKVLLLEAGGEEPFPQDIPAFYNYDTTSRLNWVYQTEAQPTGCAGKPCTWRAGKVLGGGSVLNGMIYNRGNAYDYDAWEKDGNVGWGFKDVLPLFKKSEDNLNPDIAKDKEYHSTKGPLSVSRMPYQDEPTKALHEAFLQMNFKNVDINGKYVTGVMLAQTTSKNGERMSSNRAFLEPVRKDRNNLKVVTNARVTKLLINEKTKTAFGVEYALEDNKNEKGKVYATKEIIVSAGAINGPQLLMLSGIGPEETLKKLNIKCIKNLKVGHNLQTHPATFAATIAVPDSLTNDPALQMLSDEFQYMQPERNGPWSSTAVTQIAVNLNSRYAPKNIDFPDINYYFQTRRLDSECKSDLNAPLCYYNRYRVIPNLYRPKSRGLVTINSTDPYAQPIIKHNYFVEEEDKNSIIDASNEAAKLANTKIFKDLGYYIDTTVTPDCNHLGFGSDNYWLCVAYNYTGFMFHQSSTNKMGPATDPTAVVCPRLKVHGIKGLRVADTSIMPNIVSGNTNVPAIMIGEKVSEIIKEDHKRK